MGSDGAPIFGLNDQVVANMIAEKRNGDFEQYFFLINNFIKHADAKAYNRHVVTGMTKPGDLLSVGQEALGLLLLENYRATWEQHVNALKRGETIPSDQVIPTKYTNPGNKRNPWSMEGMQRFNELHAEVDQDRESDAGKKFENDFKTRMLAEAGRARTRKRKAIPEVEVAAVHDLDSDSDNDNGSGGRPRAAGSASAISDLSSRSSTASVPSIGL